MGFTDIPLPTHLIAGLEMTATTTGFTTASFDQFVSERSEPAWLSERRRAAYAAFDSTPLPSLRDEEWRRTDIRALKLKLFGLPSIGDRGPVATGLEGLEPLLDSLAERYGHGLATIDSTPARHVGGDLPHGVVFMDLNQAVRDHPELIQRYLLCRAVTGDADAFDMLHAAAWSGGAFLYVPKGVRLEEPLFHLIGMTAASSSDLSHTLVVLEDGAEATLVQETASADRGEQPALHCGAVELFVGQGAKLRFVNIQNWDAQTWHFSRERALVAKDGALQWTVGGLGARLGKVNQEVALTGSGSRAQVNGVVFTTGRQHLAYFTRQDHQADHTTSDLLYKAGLKDHSRLVWKGMIRVEKDAQKTDAYQKNDNLILSDQARGDSIPGLEIEANDVRCTHGATAGRVDEEMIFYAQSRGIDRATAIQLIVEGFFANVYDRITIESVRETLRQAVEAKLRA